MKYFILIIILIPFPIHATTFKCPATIKYDFDKRYSNDDIKKYKFSTILEESNKVSYVSRCSYSVIDQKVTCDKYKVDKIEHDKSVNIKKYYVFRSQYNFQIFSNFTSLEDNGRGGIQYGKCVITLP